MKTNNRQQLLVIVASVAVAVLFGDHLILSPLMRVWQDRATRIQHLTEQIRQGDVLLQRDRAIQERWASIRTNSLPVDVSKAESQALAAINRWEQDSGTKLSSQSQQWKRNAEDYMTFECRADSVGSIQSVTRFLYDMATDPLPFKLEELEITSRDNNGQQLAMVVRMTGLLISSEEEQ